MTGKIFIKIAAVSALVCALLLAAEIALRLQTFVKPDGFRNEVPWNEVLHHGNGKFTVANYSPDCGGDKLKLLLPGDSWMEDEDMSGVIGHELAARTGKCVQAINGGTNSYSPSLYLLKGRQAFNEFGSIDYVIVKIDETDIGDE